MPPGWNGTTSSRENCKSVAVTAGRRSPMPCPLMQANILSLTKYASRRLIFFAMTPGSLRSSASICALRTDSGESVLMECAWRVAKTSGGGKYRVLPREVVIVAAAVVDDRRGGAGVAGLELNDAGGQG